MQILDQIVASAKDKAKLAKLKLITNWDLALHIPLRYEDLTRIYPIQEVKPGQQVMIEGTILGAEVSHKRSKQLIVRVDDGSGILSLLFFHFYPNYHSQYAAGKKIRAHGEVKTDHFGNKLIIHPKIQAVTPTGKLSNTFRPIYPSTQGLASDSIANLVHGLFEKQIIPETLPAAIYQRYQLLSLNQALLTLHKLTPAQAAQDYQKYALKRLKFDELIAQQLLMRRIYQHKHQRPAPSLRPTHHFILPLLAKLPFKLTVAQQKAIEEIVADLSQSRQMNRLLQGDVGSGKTIVATLAALAAIENNYQAVIMAPTEILAKQHYLKTQALLADLGISVVWLSGSLSKSQKQQARTQISAGSAQLIIGTHAIFQKDIEFNNLGLVIIDEQHRFGVAQRLALVSKGNPDLAPHQLMMSATPIPRSLAMSYYADLDVTTINELPPGRTPIATILIKYQRKAEVLEFVASHAQQGRQIYWVCPLIEESEKLELENAIATFNELSHALAPLTVGLVHGKLKPKEKDQVMHEFSQGTISVLVATTVIEVGVDVPNASIMVIEHSERMGLAQLHQLRGRVGRGAHASQCILLYEPNLSELAKARLKAISSSQDGFEIARQDLLIRGPGELLGERQSGLPALRFANLEEDLSILEAARTIADELIQHYPESARQLVELWFYQQQIYATV